MIQRVQSLYLLLAAIVMILTFFIPVAEYTDGEGIQYNVFVDFWSWLVTMASVAVILNTGAIFLFKKRRLQTILIFLAMILQLVFFGLLVYQVEFINTPFGTDTDGAITWGTFFPFLAILFDLLAMNYIRRDEKLIRSMDRLR